MKKSISYVFLFFIEFSTYVDAQIAPAAKPWSITDCFTYATEHNIQISTLRLNELSSLQDLYVARAAKIPSLSGSVTNTFNNSKNNSTAGDGHLINQLISSGSYAVNSSVVLWNDNYINNNIRQRELLTRQAELSVQQGLNNITLLITQAYLDILLSKENLKYISDLVSASGARVKQGQLFYDAGSIAKKDLLQLQAQLAGDKYLLVQTQNTIRFNLLALKQLLQLPADTIFDIITPDTVAVASSLIPLYKVRQAALHDFPEIKIGILEMNIADLDIAKAKAAFKPTLLASGALGTGYNEVITNPVSAKTGYFTQTGNNFYQRAALTLSIPVFSNRINKANLEKANIAFKMAKLNFQNNQLVLSQATEQAWLNAGNAMQAFAAAGEQLQAATETWRIANEQFKLGAINSYDLLQQRNQYVQAVQAYTQAKYTAVLQQKIYEFYMGRPVTL